MIPQLHGWEATEPPPWRWRVACGVGRSHAMAMGAARLVRISADCKGEDRGKLFCFFAKAIANPYRITGMGKNTISTGFILLSCGDVIALSQFNLSLWEAVAFGALCAVSYGLGLFSGLAE